MELDRSTLSDHLKDLILCLESVAHYALFLEFKNSELIIEKRFLLRLVSAFDDLNHRLNTISLDIYHESGDKRRPLRRYQPRYSLTHSPTHSPTHSLTHSLRYLSLRIITLFIIGVNRFYRLLRHKNMGYSRCRLFIPSLENSFSNFDSNSWVLPSLRDLLDSDVNDTRGHGIARYSLTHSLTITHSPTHLLTHSFTHSLTHLLTHSLTRLRTYLLTHSLTITHALTITHSLTHSLVRAVLDSARGSYLLANTDISINSKSILESLVKLPRSRFDVYSLTETSPNGKKRITKAKEGFRDYLYQLKTDLYGSHSYSLTHLLTHSLV